MSKWMRAQTRLHAWARMSIASSQSPQERLLEAYRAVTGLLMDPHILNDEVRKTMEQLVASCRGEASQREATVPAVISQMSDEKVSFLLSKFLDLFVKVNDLLNLED